ncbi:ejaculatory bulb-specific protein 3-like [Diprion similis]|uniref:ejaculatory bulb-specific protein 3-like n=1 Tax=Diprion similis TaxID=362088 RepID=UPI001EF9895C|nr:ejaculatory bulb-specific protein 3-like [Diprion similis]
MLRFTFVVGFALAILGIVATEELYPDKYDGIDPLGIVENDRLRKQYYKCFMDAGPCVTADAQFFKGFFPEAVLTKCRKCTEKQKESLDILVAWYVEHQPDDWNTLVKHFLENAQKQKH